MGDVGIVWGKARQMERFCSRVVSPELEGVWRGESWTEFTIRFTMTKKPACKCKFRVRAFVLARLIKIVAKYCSHNSIWMLIFTNKVHNLDSMFIYSIRKGCKARMPRYSTLLVVPNTKSYTCHLFTFWN